MMSMELLFLLNTFIGLAFSYDAPLFVNGRPYGGFLGDPHVEHPELLENTVHEWFTQKLDHFDNSDVRTWNQRYFLNSLHFTGSGPVFLMVGGEGTLSPMWLSVGAMAEYGRQDNALMFGLEHRFYGKSHPLSDTSVGSLKYLTSEQALADLAVFRQAMAKKYRLTDKNKWIIFGGSYPGALSAWFRYKYPHLAHGAVASSAPIKAVLDFPEYFEVATQSLGTEECQHNVKHATSKIESLLKTSSGLQYLSTRFRICSPLLSSKPDDLLMFSSLINDNFFGVIQYNQDNRANTLAANRVNIHTLCSIMNNTTIGDEVERYATINDMFLNSYSRSCMDVSYTNYVHFMRETNWGSGNAGGARQWTYQTCTEFGYFQTSDSKDQVFGTNTPLKLFLKQCVDIYGTTFSESNNKRGIEWTNSNYGEYKLANSTSRIIFPNGSIDPWHALSILKSKGDVIAIYIEGASHCANMYPSNPRDPKQLADAKRMIGEIVKKWLQN